MIIVLFLVNMIEQLHCIYENVKCINKNMFMSIRNSGRNSSMNLLHINKQYIVFIVLFFISMIEYLQYARRM